MDRQALQPAPSSTFRPRQLTEAAGELLRFLPAGAVRDRLKDFYYAVMMMQTGGRGIRSMLPHGEIVRVLPRHRHLSWNPAEYEAFRGAVQPGATALDIGANVGAYSLLLGQWVGTKGRVFAFEPAPAIFDGLSRHIVLNGLSSIVMPVASAVGSCVTTTASLVLAGTHGESHLASAHDAAAPSVHVALTTVDRFCEEQRIAPSFIKVDVEGFELSVLRGARETIARAGRDLALFVEMHPSVWPLIGTSREDILRELDVQRLDIEPLAPTQDVWAVEGLCVRLTRR